MLTTTTTLLQLTATSLLLLILISSRHSQAHRTGEQENLLASPADLIRSRGFQAREHSVVTPDGYVLSLIEASNPLIDVSPNNKNNIPRQPVLFIHGTLTSSKCFIVYSQGAKPADYSRFNASLLSLDKLNQLLENDKSKNSLVFLLLNFGHPVWLLNRRGSSYSQNQTIISTTKHTTTTYFTNIIQSSTTINQLAVESTTNNLIPNSILTIGEHLEETGSQVKHMLMGNPIGRIVKRLAEPIINLNSPLNSNPKYWNYSLDEQAKFDIPAVVDYVLQRGANKFKKLILVGHSVGGALPIMSMSTNRTLEEKVSKALLWAPALHLGASVKSSEKLSLLRQLFYLIQSPLSKFNGAIKPSLIVPLLENLMSIVCERSTTLIKDAICLSLYDMILGPGGHEQAIEPGFLAAFLDTSSAHELAQLIQSMEFTKTHYYDFGSKSLNFYKYNSIRPPEYNFRNLSFKRFSIWWGGTDSLVEPEAVELLLKDLSASEANSGETKQRRRRQASQDEIDKHFLNATNLFFDHGSFLIHKNVADLLIIPSLRAIQAG